MQSLTSVGVYYQNNRQPAYSFNNPNRKPTQQATNNANSSRPIQFGLGPASMFIAGQAGNALFAKGIQGIIKDLEKLAKLSNLSEDLNYRNGMTSLTLSLEEDNLAKRQNYLDQAETSFRHAADAQPYKVLAMACWVYAAQCAKEGGKSQGVVNLLCENAENAFQESRDQILKEREELMAPYKPSNFTRLLLISPFLLVSSLYLFFHPNNTQTARAYFIKKGYGQKEWARVEQNENLAKRFNNASQGLLDLITNLHSNHIKREFDTSQLIPPEVPLWTFLNSHNKNHRHLQYQLSALNNQGTGAIAPYDASIPGDIV